LRLPVADLPGWSQQVSVANVLPDNVSSSFTQPLGTTDMLRVTVRVIYDGPYTDIQTWHYERLPDLLGAGRAWRVTTPREFVDAWDQAVADPDQFALLNVQLDPMDTCPALVRLGERLGARVG